MATWSDKALDQALRRARNRRERADRGRRRARLDERIARLEGWLALPEAERPERRRLPIQVDSVQSVLRTVATLSAGTPLGPVLSGLALGIGAVDRVSGALRSKDRRELVDAVAAAVAERVPGSDEDREDAVDRVVEALEDTLL